MKSLLFIVSISILACNSSEHVQELKNASMYVQQVQSSRTAKDNDFAGSAQSPFGAMNPEFKGLNYFHPDPAYRVKYSLNKTSPEDANIIDTKGKKRKYRDMGSIAFMLLNKKYTLHVFNDGTEKHYFIPFKDLSNGNTTYEGGRYVEIDSGSSVGFIDFNMAYNPYCHYNHNFSCPVVPAINTLAVEINAGEKKYR